MARLHVFAVSHFRAVCWRDDPRAVHDRVNHFHVQLAGSRPGYETLEIETAFSIAEF